MQSYSKITSEETATTEVDQTTTTGEIEEVPTPTTQIHTGEVRKPLNIGANQTKEDTLTEEKEGAIPK